MLIDNAIMDIEPGCEAAAEAMLSWLDAVETGDFDRLENILDDRFRLTCDPAAAGGRFDKAQFIALDRHIVESRFDVLGLTARRCNDIVITQFFAKVDERLEGDLGPGMPTAEQLGSYLNDSPLAYASMWRAGADGQWRCVQHHVFGSVAQYDAGGPGIAAES